MAATIVQSKTGAVNVGDASVDVAFDVAPTSGNVVVLCVGSDDYDTGNPTGFTLSSECAQETFMGCYLWWRVSNGGNSFTYNIGSAATSCWILLEISGLESSPYDVSEGQFVQASSESITTPNMTPTAGERWMLTLVGFTRSANFTAAPNGIASYLNSFVEIAEISTVLGSGTRDQIGVAHRSVTADGSTAYSSGATSDGAGVATSRVGIIIAFKVAAENEEVTGTATAPFTFGTSASGQKTVHGAATRTTTFTADAAGRRTRYGSATAPVTFGTSASGQKTVHGAATLAVTFSAPAAGQGAAEVVTGTATAPFTFAAPASGTRTTPGSATRAITFAAPAAGQRTVRGVATLTSTFGSAASGVRTGKGSAAAAVTFSSTAAGVRATRGSATAVFSFATAAFGSAGPVGVVVRPFTGTTARPDDGIVDRPFTGVVPRP